MCTETPSTSARKSLLQKQTRPLISGRLKASTTSSSPLRATYGRLACESRDQELDGVFSFFSFFSFAILQRLSRNYEAFPGLSLDVDAYLSQNSICEWWAWNIICTTDLLSLLAALHFCHYFSFSWSYRVCLLLPHLARFSLGVLLSHAYRFCTVVRVPFLHSG